MQQPSNQDGGAGSELRSDAKQLGSTAADRIHSEVDARKDTAAQQAQSVSSAVRDAADGLDDNSPQWLKSAFRQGAEQIQRLAETIEQKDSRQMMNEAQDFARNHPGTFLLGCAAAGFAAARVLKAGGAQQEDSRSGGAQSYGADQPYGGQTGQSGQSGGTSYAAYGNDPMSRSSSPETGVRAQSPGEFA